MVENTGLQICPESPISVHLYWDAVTVRSHGSNHFLTHQTSQWALVPCGWGAFSSWRSVQSFKRWYRGIQVDKNNLHPQQNRLCLRVFYFPLICHLHRCPYVVCASSSAAGRLSFKDLVIQVKKRNVFLFGFSDKDVIEEIDQTSDGKILKKCGYSMCV